MERISRGDIWVVELAAHPKPRPAIVMSINPINDLCPDVLMVPITTKPGPLRVEIGEQPATGLRVKSFAKCESLGPIHKSRLKKKIGQMPNVEVAKLESGVRRVLGL
ncbi:MAG: type II toxin-antitoxin system PemK/MazF family toxin [Nitrospirota bacterium]